MSLIMIPGAYVILILALNSELTVGAGWTLYPPLSTSLMSLSPIGMVCLCKGLLVSGVASTLTSANFLGTAMYSRGNGITMNTLSYSSYPYTILVTSLLLLFVLPVLTGALVMLLADLQYNSLFY